MIIVTTTNIIILSIVYSNNNYHINDDMCLFCCFSMGHIQYMQDICYMIQHPCLFWSSLVLVHFSYTLWCWLKRVLSVFLHIFKKASHRTTICASHLPCERWDQFKVKLANPKFGKLEMDPISFNKWGAFSNRRKDLFYMCLRLRLGWRDMLQETIEELMVKAMVSGSDLSLKQSKSF